LDYNFEWDTQKARENLKKHKITFQRAATIFRDPHAISIIDEEHSLEEERWLTLGLDSSGIVLVVCHTFRRVDEYTATIRLISARKATKTEQQQYTGINP